MNTERRVEFGFGGREQVVAIDAPVVGDRGHTPHRLDSLSIEANPDGDTAVIVLQEVDAITGVIKCTRTSMPFPLGMLSDLASRRLATETERAYLVLPDLQIAIEVATQLGVDGEYDRENPPPAWKRLEEAADHADVVYRQIIGSRVPMPHFRADAEEALHCLTAAIEGIDSVSVQQA